MSRPHCRYLDRVVVPPFGEITNEYGAALIRSYEELNDYEDRLAFVRRFAWSIPTHEFAVEIAERSVSLIEIGAGTGYWKHYLSQFGIDVLAFDIAPQNHYAGGNWAEVKEGDERKVREFPDRDLFMCWIPNESDAAYQAVLSFTGDFIFYVGEGKGGCTANDAFYDLMSREWDEVYQGDPPNWYGVYSEDVIYQRKANPLSLNPL